MATLTLRCPETNQDGAFRLAWEGGGKGAVYRLLEDGALLYEGRDLASTVTGRHEGVYAYELALQDGVVGARCEVAVRPHSLADAFGLFALGAVVFVSTLVAIVHGHRAHRAGRIG